MSGSERFDDAARAGEAEAAEAVRSGDAESAAPASVGEAEAASVGLERFDDAARAGAILIGETFGPLFSEDPVQGQAGPVLAAIAELDPESALEEWPFVQNRREAAAAALSELIEGAKRPRPELAEEYRRLFVGPATKVAPPWGSVYTDYEGVMFGHTALALTDFLVSNGISSQRERHLPDDHFGSLMSLLAWMTREKPGLVPRFAAEHLLTWSGHFLQRVAERSEHPLYRGAARLCDASLQGFQEELALNVRQPRFFR